MKPLILDFCLPREQDVEPNYTYDYELNLNVINIKNTKLPFVEANIGSLELMTKTEAKRERDDESTNLFELQTKTKVIRERDDEQICLLELMTKTLVDRERDDADNSFLLELLTKSRIPRESDDENDIDYNQ